MNRSLVYAVIGFLLYFIQNVVYSLLTGSFSMDSHWATALSSVVVVLAMFGLLHNKEGWHYYGISNGEKPERISVNVVLFVFPVINLVVLLSPVKVNLFEVLVSGLFIGLMEELIFRGFLYRGIEEKAGTVKAVAISSVIFGLYHLVNLGSDSLALVLLQVVYAMAIGIAFAVVFALTRSLLLCIICHALVDILSFCGGALSVQTEVIMTLVCIAVAYYYWNMLQREKSFG